MKKAIFLFIRGNKGASMLEIAIVLLLAGILVAGFMGSWGDRDRLMDGWRIESIGTVRYIIDKEKKYYNLNFGKFTDNIPRTGQYETPVRDLLIDIRTKTYFPEFSLEVRSESAPDAFGVMRTLDILYVKLYGTGPAKGVIRTAKYNIFADQIEWTDSYEDEDNP